MDLSGEITIYFGLVISLVIVGIGIVSLFLLYRSKQLQSLKEKELLETNFQQQLLKLQLEIQEETFSSISREIHDNVGQILSLAKVQLNIVEQTQKFDQLTIGSIKENITKALGDLRDIAKSLSTERIQLLDLPTLIDEEILRIDRSGVIKIFATQEGRCKWISEQRKLVIFRMIQEIFQNIFKHARAKSIHIDCRYEAGEIIIMILDDGIGFDASNLSVGTGLGIINLKKRAVSIDGLITIESVVGKGTSVTLNSPYE